MKRKAVGGGGGGGGRGEGRGGVRPAKHCIVLRALASSFVSIPIFFLVV